MDFRTRANRQAWEAASVKYVREYDERCLSIFSRDVLKRLRSGDAAWETMVPQAVAHLVKERGLLGYLADAA